MTPNFIPKFRFNQLVVVLDEMGFPTAARGYVQARFRGSDGDTGEYSIMLTPIGGACHYPAARLLPVEEEPRVTHRMPRRKQRAGRNGQRAAQPQEAGGGPPTD